MISGKTAYSGFASVCAIFMAIAVSQSRADIESVTIAMPMSVAFYVLDVSETTVGLPTPSTFTFTAAHLNTGHSMRISAKAGATTFAGPSGTQIPASNISWTVSGASGGSGVAGTLDASSYHDLFDSISNPSQGRCDITFSLAPLPSRVRAGLHSLNIIWKVESLGY